MHDKVSVVDRFSFWYPSTDLQKAFDTVNHPVLLKKLEHYDIRGVELSWFSSYLSKRKQFVSVNGSTSDCLEVSCGVPQGSVLDS